MCIPIAQPDENIISASPAIDNQKVKENVKLDMDSTEMRAHYEALFSDYPDVVDLPTFRRMLGGVSEAFARRMLREKRLTSIKAHAVHHEAYFIPKQCVLNFVLSEDYQRSKARLKHQI